MEALKRAQQYNKSKKAWRIVTEVKGEWFFLAKYKVGTAQTVSFEPSMEHMVTGGWLSGIRVWTNDESKAFVYGDETAVRDIISRLFGSEAHKRYKIIAGTR